MTEILAQIMVEVLVIVGMATKEVKSGRLSESIADGIMIPDLKFYSEKYLKKLVGNTEMEDSLGKLDNLT